jgi:hypothetical protein
MGTIMPSKPEPRTVVIQRRVEFIESLALTLAPGFGMDEILQLLRQGGTMGDGKIKNSAGKVMATYSGDPVAGIRREGAWEDGD